MTASESRRSNDRESLDLDLLQYLTFFKRRWLLVAVIMLGTLGLSVLAALLKPSAYEADAKLLIKVDRTSTLTGFGEGVGELSPLVTAQNPLSTELEVMTSRPLLIQVIEQLNLEDSRGDAVSAKALQKKVKAEILGGADVIQISFESPDPQLSATVVNSLADIYIDNNISENRSQSTKALKLLEERLPESEAFVSQSEAELKNFKESNNIISLADEAKSTVEILEDVESQALTTSVDLKEATVRANQLQDNLGLTVREAMLVSELGQAPAVQGILQDLQTLERQKSVNLGFYTAEAPAVQHAQAQIDSLQRLLQQEMAVVLNGSQPVLRRFWQVGDTQQAFLTGFIEAETVRLSLSQRLEALEGVLALYSERGETLPQLEQSQAELERKLEVARSSYQGLLERLQALQSAETQVVGNARLIESAIAPEDPTSSKKIIVIAGIVVGAFISTAAVALLEIIEAQRRTQLQRGSGESNIELLPSQPVPVNSHASGANGSSNGNASSRSNGSSASGSNGSSASGSNGSPQQD